MFVVLSLIGLAFALLAMRYLWRRSAALAAGLVVAQPFLVVAIGYQELAMAREPIVLWAGAGLVGTEFLYAVIWAVMLVPYMVAARVASLRRLRQVLLALTAVAWGFWLWVTPISSIHDVTGVCLWPGTEYTLTGDGEVRVECDLPPG